MQPQDLAFYTTQELIDELMRRKTFLGVVVQCEEELRTGRWTGEKTFRVHLNDNLDATHAGRLLGAVAEYIDRQEF
jgi:hypothetical protein